MHFLLATRLEVSISSSREPKKTFFLHNRLCNLFAINLKAGADQKQYRIFFQMASFFSLLESSF